MVLDVADKQAIKLCEFVDELGRVGAVKPFRNRHFSRFIVGLQDFLGLGRCLPGIVAVLHEMLLQFGHGDLSVRECTSKLLSEHLLFAMESQEELLHLVVRCVVQFYLFIGSTRAQQSRVQPFPVVGSHEEDTAFLGTHTVEGIQESGERHLPASTLLLHRRSFHEDAVDIFQENNGGGGRFVQQGVDAVVVQRATGQVQVADVEVELSSHSLGEGGLASSGRSVEQVPASVWHSLISVPLGGLLEPLDVLHEFLR